MKNLKNLEKGKKLAKKKKKNMTQGETSRWWNARSSSRAAALDRDGRSLEEGAWEGRIRSGGEFA